MKIKIQQFLCGKNHSWSVVGKAIGKELLKLNNYVDFISTDGIKDQFIPDYIRPHLKKEPDGIYDMQLSYTAMRNFKPYLSSGTKNRFGIYNYDGSILPNHWVGTYRNLDLILPSSQYAKKVFLDAKIPESSLQVVPHGVDLSDYQTEPYQLKTNKKIKILNVCGQVHRRKNLNGILEAYGKAFSQDDDVCLVLKVADKKPSASFEVSFRDLYKEWRSKNPKAGEVEIIYNYIDKIESLFLSCDIHFSLSNIECFHIPSLQSMAAGMVTIQSAYGGHTDFLNTDNSLLVEGKLGRCPPNYQYWTPSPYAEMFIPNLDDAVDKLKYAVENYETLHEQFTPYMKSTVEKLSWSNVTNQILSLVT